MPLRVDENGHVFDIPVPDRSMPLPGRPLNFKETFWYIWLPHWPEAVLLLLALLLGIMWAVEGW